MSATLMQISMQGLKEKCPAFATGCPYATPELKRLLEKAEQFKTFQGVCPFGNSQSLSNVYEMIIKLSQVKSQPNDWLDKGLLKMLNFMHTISREKSHTVGKCPVFSTDSGCPFKSIGMDGHSLLNNLDACSWVKVVHEAPDDSKCDILLSKEFKSGTKKIHREAERVHFVRAFLKGNVDEKLYRAFVASLYFIYRALETESKVCADHPMFSQIHFPEQLDRVKSLEKDLQFFYGDDWQDEITMSDVVTEYVDHIHSISKKDPALMISHHYTRYLGDLSGGQVLKKAAVKACGLPSTGEGVEFYEFRNIQSARDFKNMYRKKLDTIHVAREKTNELVEEAKIAFMFNIKLFKELDVLGGFMEEIIHEMVDAQSTSKNEACPFLVKKKDDESNDNGVGSVGDDKLSQCPIAVIKRSFYRIALMASVIVMLVAVMLAVVI